MNPSRQFPRKAGDESPLGIWWFKGTHYTQPDPDAALSLVRKLGFRHTTPRLNSRHGQTPAKFAEYQVTPSMMGYVRKKESESLATEAKKFLADWPQARWAMVFHETRGPDLGLGFPPEILGEPPPELDDEAKQKFEELRRQAMSYVDTVRGVKPDLKIVLGNGGTAFNVHWLRCGFPRSHWDALGMEMAVQTFPPESQPHGWNLQGLWIARRMREIYGYQDLPITSCYEFDYRATAPGAMTLARQAAWYARDALHCLAYRLPHINIGLLDDCNSAYYTGRWGSTGVCGRAPLNMPKPSFVTLATLTRVLDRARYERCLDPGSTAAYCLEFRRPQGDYAYALWTTGGRRSVHPRWKERPPAAVAIDAMGRQRSIDPASALWIDESPLYLVTAARLEAIRAGEVRHDRQALGPTAVIDRLGDASAWRVSAGPDELLENWCGYYELRPAKVSAGPDEEAGLRIDLHSQPELADVVGRYVALEPAAGGLPIPGRPTSVGVWVRGNGAWGRVIFELRDAQGRRWVSIGPGGESRSWDLSDWQGDTCISFDGWKLVTLGLPDHYEGSGYPGPNARNWRCLEGSVKIDRIAYPVTFTRLYLILREKLVYLTDMVPAKSMSIAVRDLTAGQ